MAEKVVRRKRTMESLTVSVLTPHAKACKEGENAFRKIKLSYNMEKMENKWKNRVESWRKRVYNV